MKVGDLVKRKPEFQTIGEWAGYCNTKGFPIDGVYEVEVVDASHIKLAGMKYRFNTNKFVLVDLIEETIARVTEDPSMQVGGTHYGTGIDVFAFSLEREHDCLQHAAIKYIDRHKAKNGKQDIEKAISVLHRILKEQYSD